VLFNSLTFLVFFACVFSLYQLISNWAARKSLLLVASYFFYAAWYPPYVLILAFSTTLDWWLARCIDVASEYSRKPLLVVSLICNLGLLGFFKYGDFLLNNFQWTADVVGVSWTPPPWNILLPIGISFYTFASLSYTIDVYRREIQAEASLLDYALFVSFFPHLVAGPIVRARLFLPQIREPRRASGDQIKWGLVLTCLGLFAKTVMADSIFAPVVEQVYAQPSAFAMTDTWAAVLGFSGQIYFDFSGYSLCAIGLALCFGFEFPDNFRYPYGARSFAEFWRRWHITLSTWLRDYLYIPLGGNRGSTVETGRNIMLTMLLGGIWHGASWMFVAWGVLHGVYLVAERWVVDRNVRHFSFVAPVVVFLVVTLTWIPFRSSDWGVGRDVLFGLCRNTGTRHIHVLPLSMSFLAIAATYIWHAVQRKGSLEERFRSWTPIAQTAVIACCLIGIFLCSGGDERAFIYFQF
jgi:alginate O-acetyltransferase complex protein AlgI